MIILEDEKIIFLHIPKCGGTSVSASLEKVSRWNDFFIGGTEDGEYKHDTWGVKFQIRKHSTSDELRRALGDFTYERYKKFILVRNPVDRFLSAYNFVIRHIELQSEWLMPGLRAYGLDRFVNFDDFLYSDFIADVVNANVANTSTKFNNLEHARVFDLVKTFLPQSFYLDINELNAGRFSFLKLEQADSFNMFMKSIGFDRGVTLESHNINGIKKITCNDLSDRTINKIAELYAVDFESFDYTFPATVEIYKNSRNQDRIYDERNYPQSTVNGADELILDKEIIAKLNQEITRRDIEISKLNQDIGKRENEISKLNQDIGKRENEIDNLCKEIHEYDKKVSDILLSNSWRVTAPFRAFSRYLKLKSFLLKSVFGRIFRSIYNCTPIPHYYKTKIKNWIFRNFGFLISWTNAYGRWAEFYGLKPDRSDSVDRLKLDYALPSLECNSLGFDQIDDPLVSIIIPVYNNWSFTENCLKSIKVNSGNLITYEVIVADDCSTDETKKRLVEIPGLKVVSNEKNLGFLRNCNNAVTYARGRYVILLNNDTRVNQNWLGLMLDVFDKFDRVGLVVSKLIYPNGRLQEAGGIMMRNGWGHPYGRSEDPNCYEFNYVKEVDCGIGACLMIDKALFERIGGFDERYAPAHYEEFDLEFAIRAAGYRVMYQPAVEIIHHESVSGGGEFRDRQSMINHEKFCKKWAEELSSRPTSEADLYLARDSSTNSKRILIIEDMVPHHDKHAGAVTIFQYVKLLRDMGFKVVFFPDNLNPVQPYTMDLQQLGVEVIYGDFDFKKWIKKFGKYIDYCWVCRPDVAIKYIDIIRLNSKAKICYYTHDLHFLRELRCYELEGNESNLNESKRLKKIENKIFASVDVVLTPSADEGSIIKDMSPKASVVTVPAYVYDFSINENRLNPVVEDRKDILFLGGYGHKPNVDAVLWFINDIFPLIRQRNPGVLFHVAGSNVPDEIMKLEGNGVRVHGYVSDLTSLFERVRVFVAPLRYGAGVKGKIVTSLYYGVPVVTTTIGNEGLGLENGKDILVADSAIDIANYVGELLIDDRQWERISHNGTQFLYQNFSDKHAKDLLKVIFP